VKVFISWSGTRSKNIGEAVRKWIPGVLQAVKPYFSPDDIAKGARWSSEIAKELEASRLGLLILTPENLQSTWMMFEAGALAKNLDKSKVCPLLFGLEPTDIKGPLVQFQAARFGPEEMKRVIKMINSELGDASLASEVLESVFTMWWPRLESEVKALLEAADEEAEASRSERDMIEEVLELARAMSRDIRRSDDFHPAALDDLAETYSRIVRTAARYPDPELAVLLNEMLRPVEHLCMRSRGGRRPSGRQMERLMEARELLIRLGPRSSSDEPSKG
jgi:hypothetical protein